MTLPNFITVLRLLLVPLIIMMIALREWDSAFAMFLLAGASDAIDGFIARRFRMKSELGAYLDAIADKALLVSIFVTLSIVHELQVWLTILVVARDIMIVSAVLLSWGMGRPVEIRPLLISKANTTAQIAFVALVLASHSLEFPLGQMERFGAFLVAALTLGSMGAYLTLWLRHMTHST